MRLSAIRSVDDLLSQLDKVQASGAKLYRGQAAYQGNLLPGVARRDPTKDTTSREKQILRSFQLLAREHLSSQARDHPLEMLVAAQHYGLVTRLLDWTEDPLVALFFACAGVGAQDRYFYLFEAEDGGFLETNAYDKDPFGFDMPMAFKPPRNNPRIIAQQGWFTIHSFYPHAGCFPALEKLHDVSPSITEFVIPSKCVADIQVSLELRNLTYQTLLPDLPGLCLYLNSKFTL